MIKRVLIIGNHPIIADLTKQYHQRGDDEPDIVSYSEINHIDMSAYREIVLLSDYEINAVDADNKAMGVLQLIAEKFIPKTYKGEKRLCHLLLRSHVLLHMIRLDGFRKEIEEKLEIHAFTMDDVWSQTVAMGLDREPITKQSEKNVHLVIFGMSNTAEQIAINAAHVCHFPNYLLNGHTIRTRITVIDDKAIEKSAEWIHKYKHLFDNSFYRYVNPHNNPIVTATHRPMYKNREDFVDIEWEFVSASPFDELVREKIAQWSISPSQLLTIVITYDSLEKGIDDALHLPEKVMTADIPIYIYMQNDEVFKQINRSRNRPHIIPFGMIDHGYDINIPIIQMAKSVNYIYNRCYEENDKDWNGHLRFPIEIDEIEKERLWMNLSGLKRISSIYNAMTIGIKMRSMGIRECEWDKFYDLSQEDIETLAEVEHNRWSVEELILGWRPCTDKEEREVESNVNMKEVLKKRKIHYDLRAYNDLRPDGTGRPVQVYDRCLSASIPLIAKESKGGISNE